MSLVTLSEVLEIANEKKSAIPAYTVDNLEVAEEIAYAAEGNSYPAIMMVGQNSFKYGKQADVAGLIKRLAWSVKAPIVLHLDHGASYEQTVECLKLGFTSVMFDGSRLPLEENIKVTRKVVEAANAAGVSVEAELGAIGGVEDGIAGKENIVDVDEVRTFIDRVKVDALAIGIGNAHGIYKSTPKLAFDRLEQVAALGAPPLVLHGGSGIPDAMIRKAIVMGMRKINVATEVRNAFMEGLREGLASKDIYKTLLSGQAAAREIIEEKMRLFMTANEVME